LNMYCKNALFVREVMMIYSWHLQNKLLSN
jgi:hypothetical protein